MLQEPHTHTLVNRGFFEGARSNKSISLPSRDEYKEPREQKSPCNQANKPKENGDRGSWKANKKINIIFIDEAPIYYISKPCGGRTRSLLISSQSLTRQPSADVIAANSEWLFDKECHQHQSGSIRSPGSLSSKALQNNSFINIIVFLIWQQLLFRPVPSTGSPDFNRIKILNWISFNLDWCWRFGRIRSRQPLLSLSSEWNLFTWPIMKGFASTHSTSRWR